MPYTDSTAGTSYTVILRRNNSLSPTGLRLLFLALFLIFAGVAVGFMLIVGTWLILPFSGLEIGVLAGAFYYLSSRAGDYERIEISGDRVVVEQKEKGVTDKVEFQRHWVRVALEEGEYGARLLLRSHGREVELGRLVRHDERFALARQLKQHLVE